MLSLKSLRVTSQGSISHQYLAADICEGCILAAFVLVTQGMKIQRTKLDSDGAHQQLQGIYEILTGWSLPFLILSNVSMAIVLLLGTLKWKLV